MTGAELRSVRRAAGMTQREFGLVLGLHPNSLARIERGERPVTARLIAAVRLLQMVYRLRVQTPILDRSETSVV